MPDTKKKNPGPQPTPQASGMGATTEQDVSSADQSTAETVPTGTITKGSSRGVTGVPKGTPIYVGEQVFGSASVPTMGVTPVSRGTQYVVGDGMKTFLMMDNTERINLLSLLAQIPGVYSKGKAPSQNMLLAMAEGQEIAVRDVDAKALEQVMRYADTVGITYDEAATKLYNNPSLASSFYGSATSKGKKVVPVESLVAEFGDKFQNTFDLPVPKDVAKQYAAEVQAAQRKNPALSAQEREDILLKYLQKQAGGFPKQEGFEARGVLGEYVRQLREEYYDNGLPMDEDKIYKMAVSALRDPQELQSKKQIIRQRAELVFPPLKEYIARGESVRDVLSPYMKLKADIFEQDVKNISPKDMYDVLEGDKLKDINKYKMELYRSPAYKKTQAYMQREISDTRGLLNYLGIS